LSKQGFSQYKDNQFDAAIQSWKQALMRYQELQNFSGKAITFKENALQQEAIVLGGLGDASYAKREYDKAIEFHQQRLVIAKKLEEPQEKAAQEGAAWGGMGNAYLAKREYDEAIKSHQQRLEISKKLENPQEKAAQEGAAWGGIGNVYLAQRQYDKAIDSHQQRLEIAERLKDYEQKSAALSSLGNTYYSRYYSRGGKKDYQEALDLFDELLTLANSRTSPDLQGAATALGGMGGTHHVKGEYKKAIEKYKQRLTIIEKLEDPVLKLELKGDTLSSLGSAYYLMGNYTEVHNYYQQSLDSARKIGDHRREAIAIGGLGSFYHAIGNYETAIEYHKQRLAIAQENNYEGEKGAALGSLGNAYHARREYGTKKDPTDYKTAIDYHEKRLAIVREIPDRRGVAITLGSLGSVYYDQGNYETAIKYHNQRLQIAKEELEDFRLEGSAQGELGTAYYSLKNFPEAIKYAKEFLRISRVIEDRSGEGNALNNLGVFYFVYGKIAQAEENLLESIKVRESLRKGLPDTEKVFFFDTQLNAYVNLQKVLIHQKKTNQALEIAERGRAQAFVELLARRQQTVEFRPITIAEIQETARIQKTTFVEYSWIEDSGIDDEKQLLIWIVKPTGTVEFKQVKLKDWEKKWKKELSSSSFFLQTALQDDRGWTQKALAVRSAIVAEEHGSKDNHKISPEDKKKVLQAFHELLIGSIADLLPSNENDRVVFIPQGALFLLPFAALQDTSGKYLIDKHTILIAPSIQLLKQLQSETTRKPLIFESLQGEDLLIVGNPTMPKLDCSEEPPLSILDGAEKEAIEIAKDLKAEAIIHDKAKEVAVTALMPKAQIIHLATHGLLDNCKGLAVPGAIALAPSGNNEVDEARDGWLTASEISKLQLQAELVVLSACDTGRGRLTGDGVIGLSRSFMGAGVPSVIVSLWNVNDNSTAVLMTQFYQHLKYQSKQGNLDKAQALRQAILKTKGMKQYSDPFDWSAFTLIGLP